MQENFHKLSIEEIIQHYDLPPNVLQSGLTTTKIQKLRLKHGSNEFYKTKKPNLLILFLKKYIQPFNLLLFLASLLSCLLYYFDPISITNLILSICILLVSVFNTLLEFHQEQKSTKLLQNFTKLVTNQSLVLRNNDNMRIVSNEIVIGDIVNLNRGDKVPADMRIIKCTNLQIDNSSLTGESQPIYKNNKISSAEYTKSKNMLFAGDLVLSGCAQCIIVNVGTNTVLGNIAKLTCTKERGKNELEVEINEYVKFLGVIALIVSVIFFAIALMNGFKIQENLLFCVGIFIAFVPQGLPATVTILLSIAAKNMARNGVLVKDLRAVETLGAMSLLASDKTGTLTQGKMTCSAIWDGEILTDAFNKENSDISRKSFEASQNYEKECDSNENKIENVIVKNDNEVKKKSKDGQNIFLDENKEDKLRKRVSLLFFASSTLRTEKNDVIFNENVIKGNHNINELSNLNNDNILNQNLSDSQNKSEERADPTEKALYKFAKQHEPTVEIKKVYEEPFDSTTKIHLSICKIENKYKLIIKGAPDNILKMCKYYNNNEIDSNFINKFDCMYEDFASTGQRVVAVAEKDISDLEMEQIITRNDQNGIEMEDLSVKYAQGDIKKNNENIANENNEIRVNKAKNNNNDISTNTNNYMDIFNESSASKTSQKKNYEEHISEIYSNKVEENKKINSNYNRKVDKEELEHNKTESLRLKNTKDQHSNKDPLLNSLNFVAMVAIVDPPKKGVRAAVMKLRLAGIQVVMVTGDHPLTATHIAKQCFILSGKTRFDILKSKKIPSHRISYKDYSSEVISGDEISKLADSDWSRILKRKEIVFARTSPQQKLEIVERFQKIGHIVGVSGDGVNDAPALKKANLGIAMNNSGSDVSKEAAHMILLNDDFSKIINGVEEGRNIFCNLRKSLKYLLSHISPQVVPFLVYVGLGFPSPMSAVLLMLIDLFTEFFPSVSLAWESSSRNLMLEQPRKLPISRDEDIETLDEYEMITYNEREENMHDKNDRINTDNVSSNTRESCSLSQQSTNSLYNSFDELTPKETVVSVINDTKIDVGNIKRSKNDNSYVKSIIQSYNKSSVNINNNNDNSDKKHGRLHVLESKTYASYNKSFPTTLNTQNNEKTNTIKKSKNIKNKETVLCDKQTLLWAYIEAGLIITTGALCSFIHTFTKHKIPISALIMSSQTYFKQNSPPLIANNLIFTNEQQMEILLQAQSAYFISILLGQSFNLFICKKNSKFGYFNKMYFKNKLPIFGTLISLIIGFSILYLEIFNKILFSRKIFVSNLIFPICSGFLLILWDYAKIKIGNQFLIFKLSKEFVQLRKAKNVKI